MDYKQHEQGYKDFYDGVPFNAEESYSWQEGWHAGHWEHYLENSNVKDVE